MPPKIEAQGARDRKGLGPTDPGGPQLLEDPLVRGHDHEPRASLAERYRVAVEDVHERRSQVCEAAEAEDHDRLPAASCLPRKGCTPSLRRSAASVSVSESIASVRTRCERSSHASNALIVGCPACSGRSRARARGGLRRRAANLSSRWFRATVAGGVRRSRGRTPPTERNWGSSCGHLSQVVAWRG